MRRILFLALSGMWIVGLPVTAQEWARKMFSTTSHEFGTVARSSKQEFAFEFSNLYKEDVHVASVRSSCGCTTPRVTQASLKTHEKSQIVAVYNTNSFLGARTRRSPWFSTGPIRRRCSCW